MRYALLALAFLLPASALAASSASFYSADRDLFIASSTPANAYYAAGTLALSGATGADLTALAGSIVLGGPVAGDALLAGGSIAVRSSVLGDLRALGGSVSLEAPITGDEVVVAGSVTDSGGIAKSVFIVAGNAALSAGAKGPVAIYANNATLSGDFASDVHIVAAGKVTLLPGTRIRGALSYEAPEQATIADPDAIKGGITYTGASYLPTSAQAHALALAAVGVFLLVKILGALILAGLLAGLFPWLAEAMAEEALDRPARSVLLTTLLGFAFLVATPVLLLLLALTFVGLGLAILLGLAYGILLLLSLIYTGIITGASLARSLWKRETILWRDAVLGMFVVCLVLMVPVVGLLLVGILAAFGAGALAKLFYRYAFVHEAATEPLL